MGISNETQALWDVVRVALVCMMLIQICGIYYDAITYVPKGFEQVLYECRFNMGDSILTRPCITVGRWEE